MVLDTLNQYVNEATRYPLLTREQEREVIARAEVNDQQALDILINSNLRYVIHEAKKFSTAKYPVTDLISAGNRGLVEAATRCRSSLLNGGRFISYAKWWIESSIQTEIAKFQSQIGMSYATYKDKKIKGEKLTFRDLDSKVNIANNNTRTKNLTLTDVLDSGEPNPEELYQQKELIEKLNLLLNTVLDERERIVIENFYGLNGRISIKSAEIAYLIRKKGKNSDCVSDKMTRYLHASALAKLRKAMTKQNF